MSTDLETQVHDYFEYVEEAQSPIDLTSLRSTGTVVPRAASRHDPTGAIPGWVAAAVAAAVVSVALGGIAWVMSPDAIEPAETSTPSPEVTPTTVASPTTQGTVPPSAGFTPDLHGSGIDVTFQLTPVEMDIGGEDFVVVEAEWLIDWEGMVWDWGDDEIRQAIAVGYRGNQTRWNAASKTLVFQQNADKPLGEDEIARFPLSFTGTSDDFEIQVHEELTGDVLATISGSLPGLDEDQILARSVIGPALAGWFFASEDGKLNHLSPPWEKFYGMSRRSRILSIGDTILAIFEVDPYELFNVWRTSTGREWEDLGRPPGASDVNELHVIDDVLYLWTNLGDLHEFWSTTDGAHWSSITQEHYESATRTRTIPLEDGPEPPDNEPTSAELRPRVDGYFDELAQDAAVISESPLILQLPPGPEPRFDPSRLGEEIPFEPLKPDDPRVTAIAEEYSDFSDPTDHGLPPDGPTLFIGRPRSAEYRLIRSTDCDALCLGIEGLQAAGETSADVWIDTDSSFDLFMVPLETAVVVVRFNASDSLWQRPTGGWAIFPNSAGGDGTYWVDLYDADGNLIATTEE